MAKIPDDTSPDGRSVNRRSALEYFTPYGHGGRILRLFSTREKIVEGLKTCAWVVPLTVLIWVYAEREQLVQAKSPNVSNVPVIISNHDSNRSVEFAADSSKTVSLKLSGTQEAVRRVADALTSRNPHDILKIEIGASLGKGQNQHVNVIDHIQNFELFRTNGVTVEESEPPDVIVNIDALASPHLGIELPPDVMNVAPSSHFEPGKVVISGPATVVNKLIAHGQLHVYPDLTAYTQLLKQPGDHIIPGLPLTLPSEITKEERDKVSIDPPEVNATISMIASDEPIDLESVPILVLSRPELFNGNSHYDLEFKDNIKSLSNVRVNGPHDQIEKLRSKQFPYAAWIKVSEDDVGADMEQSQKLTYQLPPGVTPSPEDADRTVEYKLTRVGP